MVNHLRLSNFFNTTLVAAFGIAAGLMLFLIIKSFFIPSVVAALAGEFTALEPLAPTPPRLTETEREDLHQRVDTFIETVKSGNLAQTQTLELDAHAINALIQDQRKPGDPWAMHVRIEGNVIHAEISHYIHPQNATGALRQLAGRYLRGDAVLTLNLVNQRLIARIVSLDVKDKSIPQWLFDRVLGERAVFDLSEDSGIAAFAQNLDSIHVQNGRVILTALQREL